MSDLAAPAPEALPDSWARLIPGVILTGGIALVAVLLRSLPWVSLLSPMILSTFIAMALGNLVAIPAGARAGIVFSLKKLLRLGIILLGLQLSAAQITQIGLQGVAIAATALVTTFLFTKWFGALIGVDKKLAELIAAGTSICGASAVIATNTVTEGSDADVAYAVACVTVFGTLAMFLYPIAPALLHLSPHNFGLWSGTSIHEIAQVVGAAFQDGPEAGKTGTIAKLTRVMMLAPLVLTLSAIATRRARALGETCAHKAPPMPWFVFGFIAMVIVSSLIPIPPAPKAAIVTATAFLLSMALAAMGLETNFRKLRAEGLKPAVLGAAASLFIAGISLALVELSAYI